MKETPSFCEGCPALRQRLEKDVTAVVVSAEKDPRRTIRRSGDTQSGSENIILSIEVTDSTNPEEPTVTRERMVVKPKERTPEQVLDAFKDCKEPVRPRFTQVPYCPVVTLIPRELRLT